ncbi:MAG: hypothetical protein ACR2HD_06860 [Solirubrobacteraceae bacterium]
MHEITAQRTLMKSAPELWSQVSDPEALGERLDLGEIRITRTEDERHVAWEGDDISGDVTLEPSGWGTRVTLTARRGGVTEEKDADEHAPVAPAGETPAGEEPVSETPPTTTVGSAARPPIDPHETVEPPALPATEVATPVESAVTDQLPARAERPAESARSAGAAPSAAPPRAKLGFWARIFGHRAPATVPAPEPTVEAPAPEPTVEAPAPEPTVEAPASQPKPAPNPVPSVKPIEPPGPQLDLAALHPRLNDVLEELGVNHHRPFSRG